MLHHPFNPFKAVVSFIQAVVIAFYKAVISSFVRHPSYPNAFVIIPHPIF